MYKTHVNGNDIVICDRLIYWVYKAKLEYADSLLLNSSAKDLPKLPRILYAFA